MPRREDLRRRRDRRQRHIGGALVGNRQGALAAVRERPQAPGKAQRRRAHPREADDLRRRRQWRAAPLRRGSLPPPTHGGADALEARRRGERQARRCGGAALRLRAAGGELPKMRLPQRPGHDAGSLQGHVGPRRCPRNRLVEVYAPRAVEHDRSILVVPRVRHSAVLEVLEVRVEALHVRGAHIAHLPAGVLAETVLGEHTIEALRVCGRSEVDEGIAYVTPVLDVHRQVEEVEVDLNPEAAVQQLLQEHDLGVFVGQIPHHHRCDICPRRLPLRDVIVFDAVDDAVFCPSFYSPIPLLGVVLLLFRGAAAAAPVLPGDGLRQQQHLLCRPAAVGGAITVTGGIAAIPAGAAATNAMRAAGNTTSALASKVVHRRAVNISEGSVQPTHTHGLRRQGQLWLQHRQTWAEI
mmetsp:Transcript_54240/g.156774  ORF Transcript_54240/g.156774 Transcript_54240/m.156774 type:complete len:410 (-) Transcript_54240:615-1844(-)